ncbi:hypothetical protein [Parafrankia sp. EAN1pec]|uniref:hypothetical protein n=1 Tax=Parafrankia sp. (strain EAN1pec) TaxID=298653 RepID=UPI00321BF202
MLTVFKIEKAMDVRAIHVREQCEDLRRGPPGTRNRPGLKLRQPRPRHARPAYRIEPEARRLSIDRVGRLLERPPERVPKRGPRPETKPPPELASDLIMAHAELAHPTTKLPLLSTLTDTGHCRLTQPSGLGKCGRLPPRATTRSDPMLRICHGRTLLCASVVTAAFLDALV